MSRQIIIVDIDMLIEGINYALSNKFEGDFRCILKALKSALVDGIKTREALYTAMKANPKASPKKIKRSMRIKTPDGCA